MLNCRGLKEHTVNFLLKALSFARDKSDSNSPSFTRLLSFLSLCVLVMKERLQNAHKRSYLLFLFHNVSRLCLRVVFPSGLYKRFLYNVL